MHKEYVTIYGTGTRSNTELTGQYLITGTWCSFKALNKYFDCAKYQSLGGCCARA